MAATISFLQTNGDGTNLSSYTFSSENIGAAASNRYVIVAIEGRTADGTGGNITGVTIGGETAVINAEASNSGNVTAIAAALVTTGTTGDIVVTFDETMGNCDIATYRAIGLNSATAFDTLTSSATPPSGIIDINAGGVCVGVSKSDNGADSCTWTGLTEDYDEADTSSNDHSGASDAFGTNQAGRTITANWGTEVRPVMSVASFDESPAISFGNNSDNVSQGTTSYSHNNDGDFLFVICQGTTAPTGVTYNSVSMTQIGTNETHSEFSRDVNIWGLVNPAQGSNTLSVTGSANVDVGAVSMIGVDQSNPYTGFAKVYDTVDSTPTLSVTTTVDDAYVLTASFGHWSSVGSGNTVIRQVVETAFQLIRSTNSVTTAGSFDVNINATGVNNVIMSVGINPAVTEKKSLLTLLGVG